MGQQKFGEDVITLQEMTDPSSGEVVFGLRESSNLPVTQAGSALTMTSDGLVDEQRAAKSISLPTDRFAGDGSVDWAQAEVDQAGGLVVSMVDGKLVTGRGPGGAQQVDLPPDRFAAPDARFRAENDEVRTLAGAGGSSVIKLLQHTSQIANWPDVSPTGWVYTSRPTSHGDELTGLVVFNPATGMYHFHFWRFDVRGNDGRLGAVDLPAFLHKHPNLTAHGTHMYPDGRGGAVLCLSRNTHGGLSSLTAVVLQAAKWADGMGEVVRGRRFPYRE